MSFLNNLFGHQISAKIDSSISLFLFPFGRLLSKLVKLVEGWKCKKLKIFSNNFSSRNEKFFGKVRFVKNVSLGGTLDVPL